MAQQKALFLTNKHGHFEVRPRSIPTPGQGELLLKVHAAALNPVDWKIQEYGLFVRDFPVVLGSDLAGEVVKVGSGVEGWSEGDKVFVQGHYKSPDFAGFQQYALAEAEFSVKIPDFMTYSQASTIPAGIGAAAFGLFLQKPLGIGLTPPFDGIAHYTDRPVLVIGGSSSVGQFAIQLLKISGFNPIIAYASARHADYLVSLGATHVLDRTVVALSGLHAEVRKVLSDASLLHIFDAISSSETQQAAYDVLGFGGDMVIVSENKINNQTEDKTVIYVLGTPYYNPAQRPFGKAFASSLANLVKDGLIKPNPVEDLPDGLGAIVDGLERLKKGLVSGKKLVGHPQGE